MLKLPGPDALALIAGESVVAFVDRGELTEGDKRQLSVAGTRGAHDVKPAYRRWLDAPTPDGVWLAIVTDVHPAALLDPQAGSSHHVLMSPGHGDLTIVRVYQEAQPVLSDETFESKRRSVQGALAT